MLVCLVFWLHLTQHIYWSQYWSHGIRCQFTVLLQVNRKMWLVLIDMHVNDELWCHSIKIMLLKHDWLPVFVCYLIMINISQLITKQFKSCKWRMSGELVLFVWFDCCGLNTIMYQQCISYLIEVHYYQTITLDF